VRIEFGALYLMLQQVERTVVDPDTEAHPALAFALRRRFLCAHHCFT